MVKFDSDYGLLTLCFIILKRWQRDLSRKCVWRKMPILYQFLQDRIVIKIKHLKRHNSNTTHALFPLKPVISLRVFSFLNLSAAFQPSLHIILVFFFPSVYSKLPSTVVKACHLLFLIRHLLLTFYVPYKHAMPKVTNNIQIKLNPLNIYLF